MNLVPRCLLLATAVALPSAVSPALSQVVLFDTLSQSVSTAGNVSTSIWYAQSFTTDSSTTAIADVAVSLKSAGAPQGNFEVQLWDSSSGKPGAKLYSVGTAAESSLAGTFSKVDFPGLNLAVNPNTKYWIVTMATGAGAGVINWGVHSFPSAQAEAYAGSSNSGAIWNPPNTGYSFLMSVSSVPEPATEAAVAAGALVAFGAYRLWRKQA